MMLKDTPRFRELQQKQLNQTLTNPEYMEFSKLQMLASREKNDYVAAESKDYANPNHSILFNPDQDQQNAANNAAEIQRKAINDNALKSTPITSGPVGENVFASKPSVAEATGLDQGYIRVNVARKNIETDDQGNVNLTSLKSFVTDRIQKSWADYLKYSEVAQKLN